MSLDDYVKEIQEMLVARGLTSSALSKDQLELVSHKTNQRRK